MYEIFIYVTANKSGLIYFEIKIQAVHSRIKLKVKHFEFTDSTLYNDISFKSFHIS